MAKAKGLGKGLGAIFQTESHILVDKEIDKVEEIKLSDIKKNPYQPRTIFDKEKIEELAESIKNNGLLQPIIVKKSLTGYIIIAGERRFRAFEMLGKENIPAIIKDLSDEEMMVFSILENLQREDLSALEEANSYRQLMDSLKITQEELAKRIGKSRPYVANSVRLLKLPLELKDKLAQGLLTPGHAKTILGLKTKKQMLEVAYKVINENMSVRALENYINKKNAETFNKKVKTVDIFIREQENQLKKILGTNVFIKQNKNQKGKIEIEFNNNEEFDRIVNLLR